MVDDQYISPFAERLTELRMNKGVSARDMSLSLGLSHNYIHNIEAGKNYPTMYIFFIICDYLEVTPQGFFDYLDVKSHEQELYAAIKALDADAQANFLRLITDLNSHKPK